MSQAVSQHLTRDIWFLNTKTVMVSVFSLSRPELDDVMNLQTEALFK